MLMETENSPRTHKAVFLDIINKLNGIIDVKINEKQLVCNIFKVTKLQKE